MANNVDSTSERKGIQHDSEDERDEVDPEVQFRQSNGNAFFRATQTKKIPEGELEFLKGQMKQAKRGYRKDSNGEEKIPKKKKYAEDDVQFTRFQISTLVVLLLMLFYVLYEREHVHICALRFYAYVAGDMDCQHMLGQRYYLGEGVTRNKTTAYYWFKQAAAQGHPHASYNLAVAHIQGWWRLERKGEAHDLIKHAASHGIREAEHILNTACAKGECDR